MKKQLHSVLIIIDTVFIGGPGKGVLQLASSLLKEGHTVIVATFSYQNPKSSEFVDALQERGIPNVLLKQRFPFDPSTISQLKKIIAEHSIQIIQTHGYKGHALALPAHHLTETRWLGLTHGWTREKKRLVIYNLFERFLLKFPEYAATVSPQLYSELSALRGVRPSSLIDNAVEPHVPSADKGESLRRKFLISDSATVFLTAGRLSAEKGHSLLLHAWSDFIVTHPNAFLLIVGDGDLRAELEQQTDRLGIEDSVRFCGYQSGLGPFYDLASAFILPSLSEGLPNVLLESLAAEVPFIGAKVGTIPEIVSTDQSAILFEKNNTVEIVAALNSFMRMSVNERQDIAANGKRLLHPRFSVEGRAARFIDIYDTLTSK